MDKNYSEALKFGMQADSLLKKLPYPMLQMNVDSMLYIACKSLGKVAEALAWHEQFLILKERITGEAQKAMLNELVVEYSVREKNLTIENQKLELFSKKRQLQLLIPLLLFTLLFIAVLFFYIVKTRSFRGQLYRKERYLDQQAEEMQYLLKANKRSHSQPEPLPELHLNMNENALLHDETVSHDVLYAECIEVVKIQKLYLDPNLNSKTLISLLGTNQKYLSRAISSHSAENFRGLINRFRVDEAKKIIEENVRNMKSFDAEDLFSASGFKSSVSFYRAFKHYTGLTPREYASEIRKELRKQGSENLTTPRDSDEDDM